MDELMCFLFAHEIDAQWTLNFEGYENNHIPSWGISPWDAVVEDCLHMDNRSMASVFPFTRCTDIYDRPTF